jgi:hypothetical protein
VCALAAAEGPVDVGVGLVGAGTIIQRARLVELFGFDPVGVVYVLGSSFFNAKTQRGKDL